MVQLVFADDSIGSIQSVLEIRVEDDITAIRATEDDIGATGTTLKWFRRMLMKMSHVIVILTACIMVVDAIVVCHVSEITSK